VLHYWLWFSAISELLEAPAPPDRRLTLEIMPRKSEQAITCLVSLGHASCLVLEGPSKLTR
jgi:hypothetical protein